MMKTKTGEVTDTMSSDSCIFVVYSSGDELEEHGALAVSDVLDNDILASFPVGEDPELRHNIYRSAVAARVVESRYGIGSAIMVTYGDRHDVVLSSIFVSDSAKGSLELPPYASIHLLVLYCINGVDALHCLHSLGGVSEVDNYVHSVSEITNVKMCKKSQRLFQFVRVRKDGRQDITRAIFIVEPSTDIKDAYDCVATYDLARDRFVHIADGSKVFKSTKEAKEYAKDYARSAPVKHGDEEAGSSTGENKLQ